MLDFLLITARATKKSRIEIYPKFLVKKSEDLMIRGRDFYAIWLEDEGRWSTDEYDALKEIDKQLDIYANQYKKEHNEDDIRVLHMWDSENGIIDKWHKYVQKQMKDNYVGLDESLVFANTPTSKENYSSKKLGYSLEEGDISAYDELMSVLYSPEERKKLEWAIGAVVSGDSTTIQKFLVLYGAAGTGKSTVLNIIQKLFDGYFAVFDARALGNGNNAFALEPFKKNPLVAIQHDGDLSHIEDNTRLNSLVSHEFMSVNEKFKSLYVTQFKSFLFMGTNKPVKITDGKSGLLRRLIDVTPSGKKVPVTTYNRLMKEIDYELGAIAYHCLDIYKNNQRIYDGYVPINMMGASNDFYNFVLENYFIFKDSDSTTLAVSWRMYDEYCNDAKVPYPLTRRAFKEELRNYFKEYHDRYSDSTGRYRSYYKGFLTDKFDGEDKQIIDIPKQDEYVIDFKEQDSILDDILSDCTAQYATRDGKPKMAWADVKTTLKDISTDKLHYVRPPQNHIVIDFDLADEKGNKSFEANLIAASKFPKTYAELSKSGNGIHLHYIYNGDIEKLSRIYDEHIEIKVFTGNSALRRKLTKCNDIPVKEISSGLPTKEVTKMDKDVLLNEQYIRNLIEKNLRKEVHDNTTQSISFIKKILDDAYAGDVDYDVSDLDGAVLNFASNSTHQVEKCIKMYTEMHFKSKKYENSFMLGSEDGEKKEGPLYIFDIEVYPNFFLLVYKERGKGKPFEILINPTQQEIQDFITKKFAGFNCRRYDNHLLYARLLGANEKECYRVSNNIINNKTGFYANAWNSSYLDVLDMVSEKKSLKKFEVELNIDHKEMDIPWDKPLPEKDLQEILRYIKSGKKIDISRDSDLPNNLVRKVIEYCCNDVVATEAVLDHYDADFKAKEILAAICGGNVNDTNNQLTTQLIFGNEKHPQSKFNYRDLGKMPKDKALFEAVWDSKSKTFEFVDYGSGDGYSVFDEDNNPIFPGYSFKYGKSTYRGFDIGEGGMVWAKPGIYFGETWCFDIGGMHPSSVFAEKLFGEEYTSRYKELFDVRVMIKHKEFDKARQALDGKLAPFLDDEKQAKQLSKALKIPINSVYGLTAAKFDNPFKDERNVDNIVAKRGSLFMVNLLSNVLAMGGEVIHIKTDSIKVVNPSDEIKKFIVEYGKLYGYTFEVEHVYEKIFLANNAVYIAKLSENDPEAPGKWTATGAQFQHPYVFKTLFSKEKVEFNDLTEIKSVNGKIFLDFIDENKEEELEALEKEYKKNQTKFKKGTLSDTDWEKIKDEYEPKIEALHHYSFIGKVGKFCPVKEGCNGGYLMRQDNNGKYSFVGGTKDWRWKEASTIKELGIENQINMNYFNKLVDDALTDMSKFEGADWFLD